MLFRSMGFSRQEYWSGLPFPTSGDLPHPRIEPASLASPPLAGGFFSLVPQGKPKLGKIRSDQSCPTLCNPVDGSPPGSFLHGILQARILEWAAIFFSRGSSRPRDQTHISCVSCIGRQTFFYHLHHLGSPSVFIG